MLRRLFLLLTLAIATLGVAAPAAAQSTLETYTSQDGTTSLKYPPGWIVSEQSGGFIILVSSPTMVDDLNRPLLSGEGAVMLRVFGSATQSDLNEALPGETPLENLQTLVNAQQGPSAGFTMGEAVTTTLGDYPAAQSTGVLEDLDNAVEVIIADYGNGVKALIFIETAADDFARIEPKIRSIAASIIYTPLPEVEPSPINLSALTPISVQNASAVQLLSRINAHDGSANWVAISPDSQIVASVGYDGGIRLWDTATGQSKTSPKAQDGSVALVLFTPDGQSLITGGEDGTMRLWDAETGEQQQIAQQVGGIWYAAISSDGENVAYISYVESKSGSVSSTVWLWALGTDTPQIVEELPGDYFANSLAFSPDGKQLLYSAGNNLRIRITLYDVARQNEVVQWSGRGTPIDVIFSASGTPLLSEMMDSQSHDWQIVNPQTGRVELTLSGHEDDIYETMLNASRTIVGTPSYDGTARLWDTQTGDMLATLQHRDSVTGMAFGSNDRLIATTDATGTLYLWGIASKN